MAEIIKVVSGWLGKILEIVLIVFIVLKIADIISWSWFYVLMPLWIPFSIISCVWSVSIVYLIYKKRKLSVPEKEDKKG